MGFAGFQGGRRRLHAIRVAEKWPVPRRPAGFQPRHDLNPEPPSSDPRTARRTARSGKDSVDHGPSGSDDHANVLFGAMYLLRRRPNLEISLHAPIQVGGGQLPAWLYDGDHGYADNPYGTNTGGL